MDSTACFTCGQNSANGHLFSDDVEKKSKFNMSHIVCQHFWFQEPDLQNSMICESCWEKVDQFHRFYQEVKRYHEQMPKPELPSVFIKQEEIEIEEEQLLDNDIEVKDEESMDAECNLEIAEESNELSMDSENVIESTSKSRSKSKAVKARKLKQQAENEFIKQHRPFDCEDCREKFNSFSTILRHTIADHGKPYITCCKVQYRCRTLLYQHVQAVLDPEAFKCEICGKCYKVQLSYVRHKQEAHAEEHQLVFKCDRCPKSFTTNLKLSRHLEIHDTLENETAKCDICFRCFATQAYLKNHRERVHQVHDANYVCEVCSKTFFRRVDFEEHRISHDLPADELKKQCPVCNKFLTNARYLKKHMRRHKNEGAYKCEQCDHVSVNSLALRSHILRRHKNNAKYVCDVCGKEYSQPVTLKEHVANAHTGKPLYECPFCDRKFFSNASMYAHRKKGHPEEWLKEHKAKYATLGKEEGIGESLN